MQKKKKKSLASIPPSGIVSVKCCVKEGSSVRYGRLTVSKTNEDTRKIFWITCLLYSFIDIFLWAVSYHGLVSVLFINQDTEY